MPPRSCCWFSSPWRRKKQSSQHSPLPAGERVRERGVGFLTPLSPQGRGLGRGAWVSLAEPTLVGSFIAPPQLVVAHPHARRQLELVAERGVGDGARVRA